MMAYMYILCCPHSDAVPGMESFWLVSVPLAKGGRNACKCEQSVACGCCNSEKMTKEVN